MPLERVNVPLGGTGRDNLTDFRDIDLDLANHDLLAVNNDGSINDLNALTANITNVTTTSANIANFIGGDLHKLLNITSFYNNTAYSSSTTTSYSANGQDFTYIANSTTSSIYVISTHYAQNTESLAEDHGYKSILKYYSGTSYVIDSSLSSYCIDRILGPKHDISRTAGYLIGNFGPNHRRSDFSNDRWYIRIGFDAYNGGEATFIYFADFIVIEYEAL